MKRMSDEEFEELRQNNYQHGRTDGIIEERNRIVKIIEEEACSLFLRWSESSLKFRELIKRIDKP
jgi:hypothetical protein